MGEKPWLDILLCSNVTTTRREADALTVAGQWRNFTAFPSILAIAVVGCAGAWAAAVMSWKQFL